MTFEAELQSWVWTSMARSILSLIDNPESVSQETHQKILCRWHMLRIANEYPVHDEFPSIALHQYSLLTDTRYLLSKSKSSYATGEQLEHFCI